MRNTYFSRYERALVEVKGNATVEGGSVLKKANQGEEYTEGNLRERGGNQQIINVRRRTDNLDLKRLRK